MRGQPYLPRVPARFRWLAGFQRGDTLTSTDSFSTAIRVRVDAGVVLTSTLSQGPLTSAPRRVRYVVAITREPARPRLLRFLLSARQKIAFIFPWNRHAGLSPTRRDLPLLSSNRSRQRIRWTSFRRSYL